jgi:hypothetical protein
MALYGKHESLKNADDPSDPVWRWFILNGPHGERFEWVRYSSVVPRDIDLLEKFIDERTSNDPDFKRKARAIALLCLNRQNTVLIRTAIQVLTVIGSDEDMVILKSFLDYKDVGVQNDVKCALFERGIKVKK